MNTLTELAWAAGFFDGEGSAFFSLGERNKNKSGRIRYSNLNLNVCQTALEPLQRFQAAVGGVGHIYGPYRNKNPRSKPFWRYYAYGKEAYEHVMYALWPYLGNIKRQQLNEKLIAWQSFPRQRSGRKPSKENPSGGH